MNRYQLGNPVTVQVTFTASTVPVDPSTIKLRIRDSSQVETIYTSGFLHPSTGVYQYQILPAFPGVWVYRWEGFGAVVAASEKSFEVVPSAFTNDY